MDYNPATGEFEDRPGVTVDFHGPNEQFDSLEPIQVCYHFHTLDSMIILPFLFSAFGMKVIGIGPVGSPIFGHWSNGLAKLATVRAKTCSARSMIGASIPHRVIHTYHN
jgi:hypothetical protein